MSIDTKAVRDALITHGQKLGAFATVQAHEPKSAPAPGLALCLFSGPLEPVQLSGLASTSMLWVWYGRVTKLMLTEPQDDIDPDIVAAGCALIESMTGGFTLGGLVRAIDVFGAASGYRLGGDLGYTDVDKAKYRAFLITIPLIFNDSFDQGA